MHHSINRSFDFSGNRIGSDAAVSRRPTRDSRTSVATETLEFKLHGANRITESREQECELGQTPQDSATRSCSLAELLPNSRFFSGTDIHFHSIADTVGTCEAGQLVVYRIGLDCPESLICDALARGAAGILTEQILPVPLPQCIVPDTDRALSEIAAQKSVADSGTRPDQRLLTIGIVGENGKGTTAHCLATILRDIPCRVAYQTDLGHSDGIATDVSEQIQRTGVSLMQHLSDSADAGAAVSVFELDSNVLRCGGYDDIGLDVLVVTPGGFVKTDFGPSAVQCAMECVRPDGVVVVGSDNRRGVAVTRAAGRSLLTYGVDTNADVSLRTLGVQDGVLTGMLRHEMNSALMESSLGQGVFTESLVAAAAVGIATNNPLVQIAESLSRLRELPGRCQAIASDDWNVAVASPKMSLDVAGSPQRMEFVLNALGKQTEARPDAVISMNSVVRARSFRKAKVWCVLAVSTHDDDAALAHYGRLFETMADQCVLTCAPDSKERFLSLSHSVLDGVKECAAIRLVADQDRAIAWAAHAASPDDTIVVLGGVNRNTPQTQRDDLQRLKEFMLQLQRDVAEVQSQHASLPSLKVYQPDA